jgi:hypothetical protein
MVAILLAVSVWNAGYQFVVTGSVRSVHFHDSDDLFHLVQTEQLSLKYGFDIYVLLAEVGGNRTLVAPRGYLYRDRVDGLSDMSLEEDRTGGPDLTEEQEARLLAMPGLEGSFDPIDTGGRRRLHIVVPPADETRLRLVLTPDAAIVVGESMLEGVLADG